MKNSRTTSSQVCLMIFTLALAGSLPLSQIIFTPALAQSSTLKPAINLPGQHVIMSTGAFTVPASTGDSPPARTTEAVQTDIGAIKLPARGQVAETPNNPSPAAKAGLDNAPEAPVEKMILKPGKSLSIGMTTEDIVCTNDVALAAKQRDAYPDSPEASFIYAVALSRTSRVEDALKEVRRARRLAEKQGGPAYFDKMIQTYENLLTYAPEDNQVRYHLAWAYYMKAYVLAKYSHLANTPQAKYKEWVAQATKPDEPPKTGDATGGTTGQISGQVAGQSAGTTSTATTGAIVTTGSSKAGAPDPTTTATQAPATSQKTAEQNENNDVLKNISKVSGTISSAPPQAIPQVQKYYRLATAKLDDLLARDPSDTWARVYRAFLKAEATGDLASAMKEWEQVRDQQPNNPAAYFFLGQGYLKQGNLKDSLFNVSKAIALRAVGN